jgi:TonB family protein
MTLALNAETVNDYVYENSQQQPQKQQPQKKKVVKKVDNDKVFDVVEEMPRFPGGDEAMMQFIANNVKYPEEASKKGKQGRVVVTFIVNEDGSISESKVVKSVDPELDAEAIRVVNAMPKWTPGKQNGHVVRVKFTIPVTFRLK